MEVEEYLVQQGMDELAASAWARFIDVVFPAIAEAQSMLAHPLYWQEHLEREGAKLTTVWHDDGINYSLPSEEGISQALDECLWEIRCNLPRDHGLRKLDVKFTAEKRLKSGRRVGKKARRADLVAASALGPGAPAIYFEAKLLVKTGDIKGSYLGESGLGCFLGPGPIYSSGPVAGMIAYVVHGDATKWLADIATSLVAQEPKAVKHIVGGVLAEHLVTEVPRPLQKNLAPLSLIHLAMRYPAVPAI